MARDGLTDTCDTAQLSGSDVPTIRFSGENHANPRYSVSSSLHDLHHYTHVLVVLTQP